MDLDHISLSTTPIWLHDDDKTVSQGTGFFYVQEVEEKQIVYLVTNYHVLTGSAPNEDEEPIVNNISFQFHKDANNPGSVKTVRFPLFTKNDDSIWLKSEKVPEADLAVFPLPSTLFENCEMNCVSKKWATESPLKVRPSSEVSIIGYPYGFYDKQNALPIWKTGNMASEPEINFDNKPLIMVDISAFPGMSGSPVFAIFYGMYETTEGGTTVGGARKFLGIYASMQMLREHKYLEELAQKTNKGITIEESLELGHVWKSELIVDLIENIDVERYIEEILKHLE
ncbi:MAG: serine protease [Candidatus Paceibacterota bacterium]